MNTGTVFNIQRYSIHDGPGIRTTIFFKGCPLDCWWCHNPESKNSNKEIIYRSDKCLGCQICLKKCKSKVLSLGAEGISRDAENCLLCGGCTKGCPTEAMELVGETMTISQAMIEIEKDKVFYDV